MRCNGHLRKREQDSSEVITSLFGECGTRKPRTQVLPSGLSPPTDRRVAWQFEHACEHGEGVCVTSRPGMTCLTRERIRPYGTVCSWTCVLGVAPIVYDVDIHLHVHMGEESMMERACQFQRSTCYSVSFHLVAMPCAE